MEDTCFDMGGRRDEVLTALDASISAHPSGALHDAKACVRGIIAAMPDQWIGCSIRWHPTPTYGYTVSISYCIAPAHPGDPSASTPAVGGTRP